MRFSAGFSAFTLYGPYLMFIYQLRQCRIIASACNKMCLEKDLYNLRRRFPDDSEQMLYKRVIKHSIPPSVAGLPNWFFSQFKDLLCMVEYFGLPDFFVTVTADEISETRWTEIDDLSTLLRTFNTELTWADAPVECARLFHERLQRFTRRFLLSPPALLGRITHSVTRYEVQSRGSVHAYIVLWVDKRDVERVSGEIVACIPGTVDELGRIARPDEPLRARLYDTVCHKQMHTCRPGGCLQDGRCKSGYPFDSHYDNSALDSVSNRWKYFRPGPEHRNVVSYHPDLLVLLNNHMNIQRVTETNWSGYMPKYAVKTEPCGELNLNVDLAARLGLHDLSEPQLKLLSATVLSRPVSPCEAALYCLQIPVVQKSDAVVFVDSLPPGLRSHRFSKWASRPVVPPIDLYCGRPSCLNKVTFPDYFKGFVIRKSIVQTSDLFVGQDAFGGLVFEHPRLVRFTDFHPASQPEAYFYGVLLRTCPFSDESELLSPENTDNSYFHECILRSIILTEAILKTI